MFDCVIYNEDLICNVEINFSFAIEDQTPTPMHWPITNHHVYFNRHMLVVIQNAYLIGQ